MRLKVGVQSLALFLNSKHAPLEAVARPTRLTKARRIQAPFLLQDHFRSYQVHQPEPCFGRFIDDDDEPVVGDENNLSDLHISLERHFFRQSEKIDAEESDKMSESKRRGPRDTSAKPKSLQDSLGGLAFPDDDCTETPMIKCFYVHVGFVRLDDNDALTFGEDVALGFDPGDDLSLGHNGAESRHKDLPDLGLDDEGAVAGTGRAFRITTA
ncbi:hypothetical protein ACFX2I_007447 [Malus domestica]